MKRIFAAACLCLGMAALPHAAMAQQSQSSANGKQDIERVIETFRTSIINKDKDAFLKLLLREDIPWIGVNSDAAVKLIAARINNNKAPDKLSSRGSARSFIEDIVSAKDRREETFDNVRIESDGEVAQVWFDYSYNIGSYKANWGKESWQLVRTGDGWKIVSVIWSMDFNPAPRPKPEQAS
jgi:ketosteroid isomerase-like protein